MELLEGAPLSEHITSLKVRKGGGSGREWERKGEKWGRNGERGGVGMSWEGEREGGGGAH